MVLKFECGNLTHKNNVLWLPYNDVMKGLKKADEYCILSHERKNLIEKLLNFGYLFFKNM
jgi:hypothetical protein